MTRRKATRSTRAARPRPAPARAHGGPRRRQGPSSANHVTLARDRHEAQADAFAARVRAGATDVAARGLLRAPAGAFDGGAGPGEPLPARLRADLEPRLGADLRAVRLHTDPRAAAAVDAAGAAALTAGAHVWFGTGAYAPDRRDGRDLLVHELAHVLQQTAVPGARRALRARDVTGTGPAQAAARTHPLRLTGVPAPPDVDEIIRRHETAGADHAPLAAAIRTLRRDLAAPGADLDRYWLALEERLLADATPDAGVDTRVLALQVDLLKRAERFESVAQLVDRFPELPTSFYDERAYTHWPVDAGYGWLRTDWARLPLLADHRLERWLATWPPLLFGITRSIQAFGAGERSYATFEREQIDRIGAAASGELIPNERTYALIAAIGDLDRGRIADLQRIVRQVAGARARPETLSVAARHGVAMTLVRYSERIAQGAELGTMAPEVQQLWRDVAPDLHMIATEAVAYWEDVRRFGDLLREGATDPALGDPRALLGRVAARPETAAFERALLGPLEALFALEEDPATGGRDVLPAADAYVRARDAVLAALARSVYAAFEAPVLRARGGRRPDTQLLRAYGFVQLALSDFRAALLEADERMPPDTLLAHRLMTGRMVAVLGALLRRDGLVRLGRRVATATLEGQTRTQLALISDWRAERADIARLTRDFNPTVAIAGLGLTPDQLVDFYLTVYAADFQAAIARELPNLAGPGTVLTRAQSSLDPARRPRRWVVDEIDYAINPEDPRSWGEIIRDHPKSQELRRTPFQIWPNRFEPHVFAWTLPDMEDLVARLRAFTPFSVVIAAHRLGVPVTEVEEAHPEVAAVQALEWGEWLDAFIAAFAAPTDAALDIRRRFGEELARERAAAMAALDAEMRRVSTLERHHRVANQLIPALQSYDRYDQLSEAETPLGRMIIWDIPVRVLDALEVLVRGLGPVDDQALQRTAAFLELGPALAHALEDDPRFDLVVAAVPLLERAIELAGADDQRRTLRALLPQHGRTTAEIDAWIAGRTRTLEALVGHLRAHQRVGQRRFGFAALRDGSKAFVVGVGHDTRVGVGVRDRFTIDGVEWDVETVHTPFVYHPEYGVEPSILEIGGNTVPAAERPALTLLTVTRNGRRIAVKGDDDAILAELSHAITMIGLVRQLEALGQLIEGVVELTLDILEFVPGAGQIVMATRLVAAILEFLTSPEFDTLVDTFFRDPQAAFEEVAGVVEQVFTPALLWEWLLFGGEALAPLRASRRPATAARRPTRAPRSIGQRLMRLVGRLLAAGRIIVRSLARAQTRVRWGMEGVELSVLRFPLLARALRLIADNFELAVSLASQLGDLTDLEEALDDFGEQIVETAMQIADFELPSRLIEPGEIVEVIVELVLSRLPRKYRIAGEVIMKLLDLIGQRQAIFDAIGDAIPDDLDPNRFWQEEVHARIEPRLRAARDAFAKEIFDLIAKFPPLDRHESVLRARQARASGPATIRDVEVGEQTEALPEPGADALRPGAPVALPADAGRPLAPAARRRYERRFGQDLGHVRVHADAAAAAAAASVGARALTSGSHVYLTGGITPGGGAGDRVVTHELTHVVQQTGPRPLGGRHPTTPTRGRPGRGLVLDVRREAEANAAAASPSAAASAGAARADAGGIQPELPLDLIRRILDRTTSTADIESDADRDARRERPANVPEDVRRRVPPDDFLREFEDVVLRGMRFGPLLDAPQVSEAIKRHLRRGAGDHVRAIRNSLDDVLLDSIVPERTRLRARRATAASPQPRWKLDVDRFADALARLVFGEAGVLLEVKLAAAGEDAPVRLRSLRAVYVHLPVIHGNNVLWRIATEGRLSNEERSALMPRLRAYLAAKGVTNEVWERSEFKLTQRVVEEVREIARAAGGPALAPADLPGKQIYLRANDPSQPIGLRLGTHAQLTAQPATERESHHITQFLLLDYFTNNSPGGPARQAFPLVVGGGSPDIYPGLTVRAGKPAEFRVGSDRMDLAGLYEGRGGAMPTISLARVTHRTGRLHIRSEQGDERATSKAPSDLIASVHRREQGDHLVDAQANATRFEEYIESRPGASRAAKEEVVARELRAAMLGTYRWMRGRMEPRLRDALVTVERTYYNELAVAKNPAAPEQLTEPELMAVWAAAIRHSRSGLEAAPYGWSL